MRRFCCLLLCLLLTLSLVPARTEALEVSAAAAVLMDADTGEILFEKNADRRMLIASTTKILTALVVLEHARLDEVVTIQPRHMAEGSSMYLKPGETLTVETLLYGLLLCSGNDAAVALGRERRALRRLDERDGAAHRHDGQLVCKPQRPRRRAALLHRARYGAPRGLRRAEPDVRAPVLDTERDGGRAHHDEP